MYLTLDYMKTIPGILKGVQIIFGILCVGLVAIYFESLFRVQSHPDLFFLFMTVTCLLGTFCLLISHIIRFGPQSITKTNYEIIFHIFCTLLLICGSSVLISGMSTHKQRLQNGEILPEVKVKVDVQSETTGQITEISKLDYPHKANIAAGVFGFFNALLNGVSVFFAFRELSR